MSLCCFVEDLATHARPRASRGPLVIQLSEQEARHARLSRRLSAGDPVVLFDGAGHLAEGTIARVTKAVVEATAGRIAFAPRPQPALTLAVAMPKGPRQDVLIEKCTELGVAALQPLSTERSVAGASDHRRDKWRRATIEAAKQSGQCWLPELHPSMDFSQVLASADCFDLVLAAMVPRERPPTSITDVLGHLATARTALAFVGPEGGWTPAEAERLLASGACAFSLGPNVLRIETAAMAVAALAHAVATAPRVASADLTS